jgi:hypothetical protein
MTPCNRTTDSKYVVVFLLIRYSQSQLVQLMLQNTVVHKSRLFSSYFYYFLRNISSNM